MRWEIQYSYSKNINEQARLGRVGNRHSRSSLRLLPVVSSYPGIDAKYDNRSSHNRELAKAKDRAISRKSISLRLASTLTVFLIAMTWLNGSAVASCAIPNTLTNGAVTDATQVMNNFAAVATCADAAIVPSGTPSNGNLAVFASPTAVTNGDLSGDCSTSGTMNVSCKKTSSSQFGMTKVDGVTITDNGNGVISATSGLPTIVTSTNNSGGVSTSAFAFKGISFTCTQPMRMTALWIQQMALISGGVYNAVIVPISGSGASGITTTAPAVFGAAYTAPSSSTTSARIAFPSPVVLVPGVSYALLLGRSDAGDTYPLPIQSPNNSVNGALLLGDFNSFARVASTTIPTGTVVDTASGSTYPALMAFEYQPL